MPSHRSLAMPDFEPSGPCLRHPPHPEEPRRGLEGRSLARPFLPSAAASHDRRRKLERPSRLRFASRLRARSVLLGESAIRPPATRRRASDGCALRLTCDLGEIDCFASLAMTGSADSICSDTAPISRKSYQIFTV